MADGPDDLPNDDRDDDRDNPLENLFDNPFAALPLFGDLAKALEGLARGDTQAAFQQFARATDLDPTFVAAHMNEGSVLLHAGDWAGAIEQYRAVLRQDDDHLDARVALGAALRGQGEHRAARREYERVLDANENHPAALFNLGVLFAEFLDRRDRARPYFERFVRVAPSSGPQAEMAQQYLRDIPAPDAPEEE